MCIIVDANAIEDIKAPSEHGEMVLRWCLTGKGGLVVGGTKLQTELGRAKSEKFQTTLTRLRQAGKLHRCDDAKVDALAAEIKAKKKCHSDDQHVIALVLESGCHLVFSKDKKLHKDLKNRAIVKHAVSIYQYRKDTHLLTECHCKGAPA